MSKKEKNYWPLMIIGFLLFGGVMGIWTIKETMNNPVELDNSYMLNYHQVNADINDILKKQQKFNKKYTLKLLTSKISKGKNSVSILLTDKNKNLIKNANILILVTRPDTTKYDKKIKLKFDKDRYIGSVDLNLEGRWNFIVKTKVGNLEGFKTYKLSTLK